MCSFVCIFTKYCIYYEYVYVFLQNIVCLVNSQVIIKCTVQTKHVRIGLKQRTITIDATITTISVVKHVLR